VIGKAKVVEKEIQKIQTLLIGDFKGMTARHFCTREGNGAWSVPGANIEELTRVISRSRKARIEKPETIILYVGNRDRAQGRGASEIETNMGNLLVEVKTTYGEKVRVLVCGLRKSAGVYLNKLIRETSEKGGAQMVFIKPGGTEKDLSREEFLGRALMKVAAEQIRSEGREGPLMDVSLSTCQQLGEEQHERRQKDFHSRWVWRRREEMENLKQAR
jgi:hypothetical protein